MKPLKTSSVATGDGALNDLIQAEQVRLLYRGLPVSICGVLLGAVVVVLVFWHVVETHLLVGWAACMVANQFWRLILWYRFNRRSLDKQAISRWATLWAIGSGVSGVLWGAASFLFFVPDSPVHQAFLLAMVISVISAGLLLIGAHLQSFYAFLIPAIVPLIVRNLIEGTTNNLTLAFIAFISGMALFSFGRNYNRILTESLRLRFENEAMARRLTAQNEELDRARKVAEAAKVQAEAANRARTQFFAAANHDLRQPLHAMGLLAGSLAEKVKDPDVVALTNTISASMEALEDLFNELLDMSRLDSGKITPDPTHFSIRQLFEKLRLEFEAEAAMKGLALRFRASGRFLYSDPVLVERILRNLISNAIRYTASGGVLVVCRNRRGRPWLEVWDTGSGIPEDQRERIFEEFVQLENPARDRRKGLGLGLSIVRRLCGLLGHELSLASQLGKGSVFRFSVPPGREVAKPTRREAEPTVGADLLRGKTVVVIEDDAEIQEGMKSLLAGWGMDVKVYPSMDDVEAAGSVMTRAPDLIIADYRLPGAATGLDAIDAVRRRFGRSIPAILMTGSADPGLVSMADEKGFHYLLKPVMPAKLRTLVSFKLKAAAAAHSRT
ncbi:MAG TPA: hybrid sensor histidine kinase/response regulator [Casimicrobiaceae bacterium]|nr:hybrid sensor histidine kinase/response regulator [Casimicrobiaceae bacterium]